MEMMNFPQRQRSEVLVRDLADTAVEKELHAASDHGCVKDSRQMCRVRNEPRGVTKILFSLGDSYDLSDPEGVVGEFRMV